MNSPIGDDAGTSHPTGKTHPAPRSIASDCSTDVTAALTKWIASVPDNSTLQLGERACYRVDGSFTIANRETLLVDGNGATIKATTKGSRIRVHIGIADSENIIVRDLTVRGANPRGGATRAAYVPELEAQHGFSLGGVRHVLLDKVQAYDVYGDFVYVSGGHGPNRGQPSDNVAVVRSRFARSGRQGIAVTNGRNVTVENNDISDVARSLFDLEPNVERNTVRAVRIEGNTTGAAVNFWIAAKGAGNQMGDIVVRGNTMRAPTGGLVFVFGGEQQGARGPFTFDGNRLRITGAVTDEGAVGAFFFTHTDTIEIRNNQIDLPPRRDMPVVELRSCRHVVVEGNRVENGGRLVMADGASADVRASE
jgi:Right handed beta helix region